MIFFWVLIKKNKKLFIIFIIIFMKNNIISYVEKKSFKYKKFPLFKVGYILNIKIWVIEGDKKRLQSFKGIVISIKNNYLNFSFLVRKISYGEGVEKLFKINSPVIHSIIVCKKKRFRKSKLYYLRYKNK